MLIAFQNVISNKIDGWEKQQNHLPIEFKSPKMLKPIESRTIEMWTGSHYSWLFEINQNIRNQNTPDKQRPFDFKSAQHLYKACWSMQDTMGL